MTTDRLGDIRLLVEVAERGTLSAAGRKLGLSPAAASARLMKLEHALQTRLFERTTRRLRPTEEGKLYLAHCRTALQALDDADAALVAGQGAVQGKLRISASADFGRHQLSAWLDEFCGLHPDLRLSLTLTDSLSNLMQDDLDLSIRFGRPADGNFIARLLAPNWRVLCAAPDYLRRHGAPQAPEDLHGHRFIVLTTANGPLNEYALARGRRTWRHVASLDQAWETNDGALATQWTLAGRGIARKTIWDVAADLRAGRLQVVLPGYIAPEPGVHALLHKNRYMTPRVRALLDFLRAKFDAATRLLDSLPGPSADPRPASQDG